MLFMVTKGRAKAGLTVEAALICPILCLILCGMIQFTLRLYQRTDTYAASLIQPQKQGLTSDRLIRLEAVAEDIF